MSDMVVWAVQGSGTAALEQHPAMPSKFSFPTSVLLALAPFMASHAQVIVIDPANVTASSEISTCCADRDPADLVNGSGLLAGLHDSNAGNMWLSTANGYGGIDPDPWVLIDLGDEYTISSIHVWNYNEVAPSFPSRGVNALTVEYGVTAALGATVPGISNLAIAPGTNGYGGEEFSGFAPFNARFIKFDIDSNHGDPDTFYGLSEVQFEGVPADDDGDGLPNSFELAHTTPPSATALNPGDDLENGGLGDGLSNLQEYQRGTDPHNSDSDGDTLGDGAEVAGVGARPPTDPSRADTDGDGLSDLVETNTGSFVGAADTGSNPTLRDTDADGTPDGVEVAGGFDPTDPTSRPAENTSLQFLNVMPTGTYPFLASGQPVNMHVDNDGVNGWLLIGRGRNGWEFDTDGQGAVAAVGDSALLGTPAAFAPALYSDAMVNDLIANSGVDLTGVEVRIRRASDPSASAPYQESRWRSQVQTTWTGDLDGGTGFAVEFEILSGLAAPVAPQVVQTRDSNPPGGNDLTRIFTWAWTGHGSQQGFSYGNVITNGSASATSYWWEIADENHAIPYTEVYIRLLNPPPLPVELSANQVLSDAMTGDEIGTLSTPAGAAGDTFSYSLVPGANSVDNAKFQVTGNRFEAGAHDFGADPEGRQYTVRVRSVGAPSGQEIEGTLLIALVIQDDTDHDGLLDVWEEQWAGAGNLGVLSGLAGADADGDGLSDLAEYELRDQYPALDPTMADSDGDTLSDGAELAGAGNRPVTDPTRADSDGDGLDDAAETATGQFVSASETGTDPTVADSDGDGVGDGREVEVGSNPNDAASTPRGLSDLHRLDRLATGNHFFTVDGITIDAYVDNDGGTGWFLVGRGRNGWEFDTDGQGDVTQVGNAGLLRTKAAFAPAMYNDDIVNDLIANSGVDLTEVEIRIRRAGDAEGTGPYQEVRWRALSRADWTGDFDFADPGYQLEHEILSGIGSPLGPVVAHSRDTFPTTGNDFTRIFTWSWNGHNFQQGFSYGQSAPGVDGNNPDTFLWESGTENHAMPYTELYIRLLNPVPEPERLRLDVARVGGNLVLEWDSRSGMLYEVSTTTDLALDPVSWEVVESDIAATPSSNTMTLPLPAEASRFYRVVEYPAPPVSLLAEDFDGVNPGWSTGFDVADVSMNTVWQLGNPAGGSITGPVAAFSAPNCYGTNIGANYGLNSNTWLRTPVIDLTNASAATLVFQEWVDSDEYMDLDRGTLRVLAAAGLPGTVTELAVLANNINGFNLNGWAEHEVDLPPAALGRPVVVEFRFESDDDDIFDGSGWYIDDVILTTPAP